MHEEVAKYINHAREYGLTDEQIKAHLAEAGWSQEVIQESFSVLEDYSEKALSFTASESFMNPSVHLNATTVAEVNKTEDVRLFTPKKEKGNYNKLIFTGLICSALLILIACVLAVVFNLSILGRSPLSILLSMANSESAAGAQSFSLEYIDPGAYAVPDLGEGVNGIVINQPRFKLTTQNRSDSSNNFAGDVNFLLSNNAFDYNAGISYKVLGDRLFIKVREQEETQVLGQLFSTFFGQNFNDKWLSFSYENSRTISNNFNSYDWFKTALSKNLIDARITGIETVNGALSLKYDLTLNRDKLKQYLLENTNGNSGNAEELNKFVDRLSIKKLEIWVGIFNRKLNKLALESNAPAVSSSAKLIVNNYSESIAKSNDNKRLADVQKLGSALALFYNDKKGYPEGVDGKPNGLFPAYIQDMPVTPPATGNCSEYYNTYWYKSEGTAKVNSKGEKVFPSYSLTFCLGQDTASFKAGLGKLTPQGIATTIACDDIEHPCFIDQNRQAYAAEYTNFFEQVDYSAKLNIVMQNSSDFSNEPITAPTEVIDISNLFKSAEPNSESPLSPAP